jgi:hypothetical protein
MAKKVKKVENYHGKKHVYGVTLYYHSNCTVLVESDEELSRNDAIDAAYAIVTQPVYKEQLEEGLQEDDDADVETLSADDYPFDKDGKLIRIHDKVMWHDPETHENIIAEVFDTSNSEVIKAKASWGSEYELYPTECVIVSI